MNLRRHYRDRFGTRLVSAFCPPAAAATAIETLLEAFPPDAPLRVQRAETDLIA